MTEQTNGYSRDEQRSRPFNPNEHVVQIKTKNGLADYLPVQWRLVWFRTQCPDGIIETEMLQLDLDRETEEEGFAWNDEKRRSEKVVKRSSGFVIFRAVVKDGKGGIATGTKSEKAASFPDYIEKAETGAIGRALAALGYGTQFAPELDEEHRIVDAPVNRGATSSSGNGGADNSTVTPITRTSVARNANKTSGNGQHAAVAEGAPGVAATEKQLVSIRKLCEYLGKPAPEQQAALSYVKAKELLDQLTLEYKQRRGA
jgi:hypothetical protein